MGSLEDLLNSIRSWREKFSYVVPPPSLVPAERTGEILESLGNIERRIIEGKGAPVRIALFGPTGAGKSKIFNSLVRSVLSPASYRRPFTRRPVYYVHEAHSGIAKTFRGEIQYHRRGGWERWILIDAPDFDSVEAENRALAARIYLETDAFIFVTDVHKYADASTWSYLERIRTEGKACAFILNKVPPGSPAEGGESPLEDYRWRLEKTFDPRGLPGPLLTIPDRPQADDDLLPEDESGLAGLHEVLGLFRSQAEAGGGYDLLRESFRIDLNRFLSAWDRFSVPLRKYGAGLRRLLDAIDGAWERRSLDLDRDLQAEVDPALKNEVYREVLKRIEKIDILRFPRRILSLPVKGVKSAFSGLWKKARRQRPVLPGEERSAFDALNLSALEGRLGDLAEDIRRVVRSEPDCPGLLGDEEFRALRLDRAAIREMYRARVAGFRSWAEEEARKAASNLTAEHKVKFILSQVIYNAVVIGVQVKTAGTLTLTEIFTDGILSPLVAKAVGMAVSSERVLQYEDQARREYSRRLLEILKEGRDRFREHLSSAAKGLEEVDAIFPEIEDLRRSRDRLVERFAGSGG